MVNNENFHIHEHEIPERREGIYCIVVGKSLSLILISKCKEKMTRSKEQSLSEHLRGTKLRVIHRNFSLNIPIFWHVLTEVILFVRTNSDSSQTRVPTVLLIELPLPVNITDGARSRLFQHLKTRVDNIGFVIKPVRKKKMTRELALQQVYPFSTPSCILTTSRGSQFFL